MNNKSHTIGYFLVAVLVFVLEGCIPAKLFSTPTITPTPMGPRQIGQNTLGLREYWRVPHTCMGGTALSLAAISGRVVCLYHDSASNRPNIRVFDATNGILLWEAPGKKGYALVVADAERVYLENDFELRTYNIEDGQQLWAMQFTPRRWHSYDPDGNKLHILQGGNGEDLFYTLDARTGEVLNSESRWTANHFLVFARFAQFDLHICTVENPFRLRAVDPITQQTLWEVEQGPGLFLRNLTWPPVLLDDVLLINVTEEIIAFDARSGQIRWRSRDSAHSSETGLVAKAIIRGDSIYALRKDARLVRMDARTGQEIGYVQFTPLLSNSGIYGGSNFPSLAIDGQMLFISFDDTNELIALGP